MGSTSTGSWFLRHRTAVTTRPNMITGGHPVRRGDGSARLFDVALTRKTLSFESYAARCVARTAVPALGRLAGTVLSENRRGTRTNERP